MATCAKCKTPYRYTIPAGQCPCGESRSYGHQMALRSNARMAEPINVDEAAPLFRLMTKARELGTPGDTPQ